MKTLDPHRRVTQVEGRGAMKQMQDGYGFDVTGRCLGRCNAQGELLKASAKANPDETQEGEGDMSPSGSVSLDELTVKELKAMAKEADIEGHATMNKAALVEAITEATEAGDETQEGEDNA